MHLFDKNEGGMDVRYGRMDSPLCENAVAESSLRWKRHRPTTTSFADAERTLLSERGCQLTITLCKGPLDCVAFVAP